MQTEFEKGGGKVGRCWQLRHSHNQSRCVASNPCPQSTTSRVAIGSTGWKKQSIIMRGTAGLPLIHGTLGLGGTLLDAVDAVAKDRPLSI